MRIEEISNWIFENQAADPSSSSSPNVVDLTIDDDSATSRESTNRPVPSDINSKQGETHFRHPPKPPGLCNSSRTKRDFENGSNSADPVVKKKRKDVKDGIYEYQVLHHRLTMPTNNNDPMTPPNFALNSEYVVDDFTVFHLQSHRPLCSLRVFEPGSTIHTDSREKFNKEREELKKGMRIRGELTKLDGKGRRDVEGVGQICEIGVKEIKISFNGAFSCTVGFITTDDHFIFLGRPSKIYADLFHSFWVIPQLIGRFAEAQSQTSSNVVDRFLEILRKTDTNRAKNSAGECTTRGIVGKIDLALQLDHFKRSLSYYSKFLPRDLRRRFHQSKKAETSVPNPDLDILSQLNRVTLPQPTLDSFSSDRDDKVVPETITMVENARMRWSPIGTPSKFEVGSWPCKATKNFEKGSRKSWMEIKLNGQTISVNDVIKFRSETVDNYGFIRAIRQVHFDDQTYVTEQYCHVHWLRSSACADEGELLLEHGVCSDVSFKHITAVLRHSNVRHVYERSRNTWRQPIHNVVGEIICDSCHSKHAMAEFQKLKLMRDGGFKIQGRRYHLGELVLIDTGTLGKEWTIGQIISPVRRVSGSRSGSANVIDFEVKMRFLERSSKPFKEKNLLLSNREDHVRLNKIVDVALVNSTTTSYPVFTYNHPTTHSNSVERLPASSKSLQDCKSCRMTAEEDEKQYEQFRNLHQPPSADYYSGGGGGIIGGEGFFNCRNAVEMDGISCETLRMNHPDMVIHCSKVSDISTWTAAMKTRTRDFFDLRDHTQPIHLQVRVSPLPEPGSIMLVLAGPPCQGHSGANHHNGVNDSRNNELFVILNEIDRLKPDFFILENVPGMKRDKADSDNLDTEGTRNFAVDAIRGLRKIGYQCRLALLDSRSFGSPQNRIRLFILCARNGVPLPTFPEPTHANPSIRVTLFAVEKDDDHNGFYVGSKGTQGSGAYPAVTAGDAISDLPAFDFQDPSGRNPSRRGIPTFSAIRTSAGANTKVGFTSPVSYSSPPKNDYQKLKRGNEVQVTDHWTGPRTRGELEIIHSNPPMLGDVNDTETHGSKRRLNPNRGAMTLLTSSAPGGKYTGGIHPEQNRTLTIAERKRIQGVPDSYRLAGNAIEQDRQVGNMINVEVSRALHSHIHRSVLYPAWLEMGKPENFMKAWREKYPIS